MSSSKRKHGDSVSPGPSAKSARAAVACERCRTKKLRCTGGAPCRSCQTSGADCNFDLGIEKLDRYIGGSDLKERVTELELAVETLTARLDNLTQSSVPHRLSVQAMTSEEHAAASAATAVSSRPDESPSERLLAATQPRPGFVAPFPPLMFHPSVWRNDSRSPSPVGQQGQSTRLGRTSYEANIHVDDDPVCTGLIAPRLALALFQFFFAHCHPMYPIIYDPPNNCQELRRRSPFLFTTILAVACRFYRHHTSTIPKPEQPELSPSTAYEIVRMAYAHLGASLFWKQHQLEDVQAVQLITLWVLTRPGQSPDQWLVSGHAARLAYRIGLNKASEKDLGSLGTPSRMERWQMWLAWYSLDGLLSLGFGRPQVSSPVTANEMAFVHILAMDERRSEAELQNARLIASLVQLSSIGRRLAATPPVPSSAQASSAAVRALSELNQELTEWFAAWLPSIVLSPTRQIAEIYGHHVRLCMSSMALNLTLSTALGPMMAPYIILGEQAATAIVQNQGILGMAGTCLNDYIGLIFTSAAVFLLRLLMVPLPVGLDREALRLTIQRSRDHFTQFDHCEYDFGKMRSRMLSEFCRASEVVLDPLPEQDQQAPFDLDWLFASSQYSFPTEGLADVNQLFGLPLNDGQMDGIF